MAQKLSNNIEAAQNFLAGLQTLDIFQGMRLKQVIALENQITKLPALGTQDAAVVVSILKDDVWGSQGPRRWVVRLLACVDQRISRRSSRRMWSLRGPRRWRLPMWNRKCGGCSEPRNRERMLILPSFMGNRPWLRRMNALQDGRAGLCPRR